MCAETNWNNLFLNKSINQTIQLISYHAKHYVVNISTLLSEPEHEVEWDLVENLSPATDGTSTLQGERCDITFRPRHLPWRPWLDIFATTRAMERRHRLCSFLHHEGIQYAPCSCEVTTCSMQLLSACVRKPTCHVCFGESCELTGGCMFMAFVQFPSSQNEQ